MYEWDHAKNASNIAKHGVSFETASRIFEGVVWTVVDMRGDYGERREISVGIVDAVVCLTVAHTDRNGRRRLISARPASRRERARYDEELRAADDDGGNRRDGG